MAISPVGCDWTLRLEPIVDALRTLPATDLIPDREAVVLRQRLDDRG